MRSQITFRGGGLSVESSSGSDAVYRAVRIASEDALPLDTALAWEDIAGQRGLPTYDTTAPDAAAQGQALVEATSDAAEKDADGSFVAWLAEYLTESGLASATRVPVDAGPVAVRDGWWLLIAEGRRPLLAWVDGAVVTLGDKADTPTLTKEVANNANDSWGESGTYGSGQTLSYRLTLTVPESLEAYDPYWVELHDEWDSRLSLVDHSVRVELTRGEKSVADLTDTARITSSDDSLIVRIDDLRATPARPGDTVVVTYAMTADPLSAPGAAGLVNDAWARFPHWDGNGETPYDRTRVYSFLVSVRKTDPNGKKLEGAVFGVRDEGGSWLAANGSFGDEKDRATFATNSDGLTERIPLLAPGDYVLVELEAPGGYALPENPEAPFSITAEHTYDELDMTVEASGAAEVTSADADSATFELTVVDEPESPGAPPGDVPKTGDPTGVAFAVLVAVGIVLMTLGLATRRREDVSR